VVGAPNTEARRSLMPGVATSFDETLDDARPKIPHHEARATNPARPRKARTRAGPAGDRRRTRDGNRAGVAGVDHRMSAGHTVTISPSGAHVEVRLDGELLAQSDRALRLDETGLPARYYLPKDDVRMDLLRPTSFQTTCPFKGEASYWSADISGQTHDGIVWAYESPIPAAAQIAGLLSFYPTRAEITVDGEVLTA
jgi:uncharacterized protein (DUF427 family)